MLCPGDNTVMHPVAVPSHYGQKVVIDQCGGCGGLWFDAFELYQVKQGSDELIGELNADGLRESSAIEQAFLRCPRDQSTLFQFDDPRFPKSIILMRCPTCQGFWLNRGEFAKYQQARQNLNSPREKKRADERLDAEVKQLLASHQAGNRDDVLGKVGSFLSTPVGTNVAGSFGAGQRLDSGRNHLDTILNVVTLLLRLFIFR